ncbi:MULTISPECIES: SDR family oxidoreductase [Rhodomicrobium]|uniref:SDR family NAD(P)-dependent oxidoreductase n=1 Tax=Rhodomicrobium TaxID=1068 RepID=UPI000B4BB4D1|nr:MULTISPECIES: SDR family oxidoreductase [Rhodomicrobium]
MNRFTGKTIIVTGAASGIGRASARMFAAEGGRVVAADRAADVHATASAIREAGGAAESVVMNAGASADVAALVDFAEKTYGRLDVVFANAGISGGAPTLFEQSEAAWLDILQVNLIGPMLAIQIAAPVLARHGGGAIVCTASVAGLRSGAGSPAYSASKAGVINLVSVAAQELAGTKVRVNGICPGLIETGMTQPIFERAAVKGTSGKIGQLNPLRRAGQPEEIAKAALFLASEDASYINGHALVVDGGLSSSLPIVPPRG